MWYTVAHKIQGCIQTEHGYNQLRQYYDYHRLPHSDEQLKFVYYRGVLQLGHYLTLKFQYRVREMRMHWNYSITRVTTLHGAWGIQSYRKQHYAMTSCLVAISDSQHPHSFSCILMHSYATGQQEITWFHGSPVTWVNGRPDQCKNASSCNIVKFTKLCATIQ